MSVGTTDGPVAANVALQRAAAQAEKDANERIQLARKRAEEAQRESTQRIDQIKDEYVRTSEMEHARNEIALDHVRNKGYEVILEAQRNYDKELNRIRREGERDTLELTEHFRNSMQQKEHVSQEDLEKLEARVFAERSFKEKTHADQLALLQADQEQQLKHLHEEKTQLYTQQKEANTAEYEKLKATSLQMNQEAQEHFQQNFEKSRNDGQKTLSRIAGDAARQINQLRQDTSVKLDAYSSRQSDPFYQLVDLGAELKENADHYVLTARVPEHERKHLSVSVQGNQVVLSGKRRNEETLELTPGHKQTTSSYQAYSQTFPFSHPVEARDLSREFNGDQFIVRIPKKTTYQRPVAAKTQPDPLRAERPKFPENIPIETARAEKGINPDDPSTRKPRRPDRTLS